MTAMATPRAVSVSTTANNPVMDPDFVKYNALSRTDSYKDRYPLKTFEEFKQIKDSMGTIELDDLSNRLCRDYTDFLGGMSQLEFKCQGPVP